MCSHSGVRGPGGQHRVAADEVWWYLKPQEFSSPLLIMLRPSLWETLLPLPHLPAQYGDRYFNTINMLCCSTPIITRGVQVMIFWLFLISINKEEWCVEQLFQLHIKYLTSLASLVATVDTLISDSVRYPTQHCGQSDEMSALAQTPPGTARPGRNKNISRGGTTLLTQFPYIMIMMGSVPGSI